MPTVRLLRQVTSARRGVILPPGEHEVTEAEAALYRMRGWTDQAPEPAADPSAAAQPLQVDLPHDVQGLHPLERRQLASKISGRADLKVDDVDAILQAELQRRGEPISAQVEPKIEPVAPKRTRRSTRRRA